MRNHVETDALCSTRGLSTPLDLDLLEPPQPPSPRRGALGMTGFPCGVLSPQLSHSAFVLGVLCSPRDSSLCCLQGRQYLQSHRNETRFPGSTLGPDSPLLSQLLRLPMLFCRISEGESRLVGCRLFRVGGPLCTPQNSSLLPASSFLTCHLSSNI